MGKKSKEARRARRDAERANASHSDVVDNEAASVEFDYVVRLVVQAVKASGAAVAPRARTQIADLIWQKHGMIEFDGVHEILRATGVVESVEEARKLWRQLQLEITRHNASAVNVAQQQQHEQVLVAKATAGKKESKASEKGGPPGKTKAHGSGARARGQQAAETLGLALSSLERKAKPRTSTQIDEILWSDSRKTAETELKSQFGVTETLAQYYQTMCKIGKSLLANELQTRTQRMYDYKARKQFQKEKR